MADKSLAEAVNDDMGGPSSDAMGADDYEASMQQFGQDMTDAIGKGDASAFEQALRQWHDLAHKYMGTPSGPDESAQHGILAIAVPHGGK